MSDLSDISKALNFGKDCLLRNSVKDAELSAELLLSDVVGLNRQSLYSHLEDELNHSQQKQYEEYIACRTKHEPIQYILGYAYFRGLKIQVEPGVLIPRPETEQLVEITIKNLKKDVYKILEIGTGSGCIACAFANEHRNVKIVATDIAEEALNCAKKNVSNYNFDEKIELVQCDMADEIHDNDFDLLISNPPYVPTQVYENLDAEVKDWEPKSALEAGKEGINFLEKLIVTAKDRLKPGGFVALEFHEENLELAKTEFENAGFKNCQVYKDLANKNRILVAYN